MPIENQSGLFAKIEFERWKHQRDPNERKSIVAPKDEWVFNLRRTSNQQKSIMINETMFFYYSQWSKFIDEIGFDEKNKK